MGKLKGLYVKEISQCIMQKAGRCWRGKPLAEGRLGRWTVLQRAKQAGTWKHSGKRFLSLRGFACWGPSAADASWGFSGTITSKRGLLCHQGRTKPAWREGKSTGMVSTCVILSPNIHQPRIFFSAGDFLAGGRMPRGCPSVFAQGCFTPWAGGGFGSTC